MSEVLFHFDEGEILLINKPFDWTSADVVRKINYAIKAKIGHAGTLDPYATGLLILATGKKTKLIPSIQDLPKVYSGSITIGHTTASYDLETDPENPMDISAITSENILETAKQFVGERDQIPPMHSAKWVDGKRAYKLARKGIEAELQPRRIIIYSFEVTRIELPKVYFTIKCSKGTYIRAIARDFGDMLGVGAYLSALCREAIGEYQLKDAYELHDFIQKVKEQKAAQLHENNS